MSYSLMAFFHYDGHFEIGGGVIVSISQVYSPANEITNVNHLDTRSPPSAAKKKQSPLPCCRSDHPYYDHRQRYSETSGTTLNSRQSVYAPEGHRCCKTILKIAY